MDTLLSNLSPPQERFLGYLEERPCYGREKELGQFGPKMEALKLGNYVQFNRAKHSYVGIDLDYDGAFLAWMDEVLPAPTIAFHNPETGHANLFWELEVPVIRPCELNRYHARNQPLRYFKAVQEGYRIALGGDSGYTSATTKNPFSPHWEVQWHDERYSLQYLAEFVTLQPTLTSPKNLGTFSGRNEELFHMARQKAYHWVFSKDENSFKSAVKDFCMEYNQEHILANWPDKGPLSKREVARIADGIAWFCIRHKETGGFKQRLKNHGVMELPPIAPELDDETKQLITSCNQARGAAYTHRIRKNKTRQKICDAIALIRSEDRYVTKQEVAQISGVGLRTLLNYKYLFKT